MTDDDASGDREHPPLDLRPYEPRDAEAVWRLHELAFRDSETDPTDIPGTDDLRNVEAAYVDAGGAFLVGTIPEEGVPGDAPQVHDGALVAIGGFLPSERGHADERTVPGAAELHRMRVAPSVQRRGYARTLLRALEARVAEAGYDPVLATTARRQAPAVAFYENEGYALVAESTAGDYDLVHFEKPL